MKIYDFEHHSYSPEAIKILRGRTENPKISENNELFFNDTFIMPLGIPGFNSPHTLFEDVADFDDERIGNMDRAGLEIAVISSTDGLEDLPKEECVRASRATNDTIAAAVERHPDRFRGAFCLPTPYLDESLEELERVVNVLGLKYWHTHSSYANNCHIYDEKYEPLFAMLSKYDIPFYIHPTCPKSEYLLDSGPMMASAGLGFGVDTMKSSIRLILRGIFDKYPNLKMILGHMAEFYPYLLDRMDNRFSISKFMDPFNNMEKTFSEYFKNGNIFMTTSGIFDPLVVKFAIEKIGSDCILFGSDYPYEDFKGSCDFIMNLDISEEDKEKICFKNAEKYILK